MSIDMIFLSCSLNHTHFKQVSNWNLTGNTFQMASCCTEISPAQLVGWLQFNCIPPMACHSVGRTWAPRTMQGR